MAQTVVKPATSMSPSGVSVTPRRITVLCGGPSAEREVSLQSGRAIADALTSIGHVPPIVDHAQRGDQRNRRERSQARRP